MPPLEPMPDLTGLLIYPEIEGNTLEFKQSLSKNCIEKLFPTICAFLNTKGGRIIFGIEDTRREIVGLTTGSKEIDKVMLKIDGVYTTRQILDEEGNPPVIGSVTGRTVTLDKDRVLLVVDVQQSSEGKTYQTTDGTCWYRLSASNYRLQTESLIPQIDDLKTKNNKLERDLKLVQEIVSKLQKNLKDTTQELDTCKKQRDAAYTQTKQVQAEFKVLVGAAKDMEQRFDMLTSALYQDILAQKESVEEDLAGQSKRSWWRCC